jgi:hypothetical protein
LERRDGKLFFDRSFCSFHCPDFLLGT